ncbi:MmgE/PrpD family protein [Bradyrhizobium sp. LHD-71]|uniref:MmgE/PrpD family protein n=1 Tax=Bradyrhizobium sp. LHD-71 TaxID=3072141 RepID=UPI00280DBD5A|nr:MmgE/PrpD family protein [Bradyrhizobium sp. LHD-71]MDQ8728291.1 MmgE/PrpD family protein [Bradyrhizobium sp. LHD-71]
MSAAAAKPEAIVTRLGGLIASFTTEQVTPKALEQARTCILDTIGVTLAGAGEPCTRILKETPGVADAPGKALIMGTARRTSALDATLVNGTAAHALDFDDFSGELGGHQSVPLVPLLFALADERGATGRALITAYVVGVETEIRIARAVNFHHYDKGWHPTATLGIFGAVAAAAHLMKLDPQRTAMALSIAASLASGLKANFGTMTKPLHIGQCGRNGLLAALLAERGFDASLNAMEHRQGFLDVFNGKGTYDVEKIFENWAEPLEIAAASIGLKQYPCCGSTHSAIFMMQELRREHGLRPDDVAHITLLPHGRRLRHTDTPQPQSSLEAKFSVQYVCARALKDGAVRLKDFEGEAHFDPVITRLLKITEAKPHPEMRDDAEQQWGSEVIVELKDGRTVRRRIENLTGRGGEYPMSSQELWDKFSDCAGRVLPREQVAPLFECLETLEEASDVAQVTKLLEVNPLHTRAPSRIVLAPVGTEQAPDTTWVP